MLVRRKIYLRSTDTTYHCYWDGEKAWFTMAAAEQIAKDVNGNGLILVYDEKSDSYLFRDVEQSSRSLYRGKIFSDFPSPLYPVGEGWADWTLVPEN